MKGILVGIQTTARFNFVDDRNHVIGTIETQIPNELAMKLHSVKMLDKLVGTANSVMMVHQAQQLASDAAMVRIKFDDHQFRSGALIGKTPQEVLSEFGDALEIPKTHTIAIIDGKAIDPAKHVLKAGQLVEFIPMGTSGPTAQAMNEAVQASRKPIRRRRLGKHHPPTKVEIDLESLTTPERNRQLQCERNNGMSVRDLAKRYNISKARIYALTATP